ncbi:hypothetical protein DPEC_G00316580, partial [Dallia pectoralis]
MDKNQPKSQQWRISALGRSKKPTAAVDTLHFTDVLRGCFAVTDMVSRGHTQTHTHTHLVINGGLFLLTATVTLLHSMAGLIGLLAYSWVSTKLASHTRSVLVKCLPKQLCDSPFNHAERWTVSILTVFTLTTKYVVVCSPLCQFLRSQMSGPAVPNVRSSGPKCQVLRSQMSGPTVPNVRSYGPKCQVLRSQMSGPAVPNVRSSGPKCQVLWSQMSDPTVPNVRSCG